MKNERKSIPALLFVFLMLFCSLSSATTTTTFGNSSEEVVIEVKEPLTYTNEVDGKVALPDGGTVTSASVKVGTAMANHSQVITFDASNNADIWDPSYNNQRTSYSNKDDFTYTEKYLSLISDGFTTDFENTDAGFHSSAIPPAMSSFDHAIMTNQDLINLSCNSGDSCWGTNPFDSYYPDDGQPGSPFEFELYSPGMWVSPTGYIAKFSSYHSLFYNNSGTSSNPVNNMYDCAYVQYDISSNGMDWTNTWQTIDFDVANSSGISYSNGLYPVGNGHNKITYCDGVATGSYALGGTSVHSQLNPNGWGTLALDLREHMNKYIRLRFVLERNENLGKNPADSFLPGWYIDDFRLGDLLPQSGSVVVEGFSASLAMGQHGFPDGYGFLQLESETTSTNSLSVDILNAQGTDVVVDNSGQVLSGLEGNTIELWDINASQYPQIQLRFNFDSGTYRLSTPTLHAIHLGSRVGSGFNDTRMLIASPPAEQGQWSTSGVMGEMLMFFPTLTDNSISPPALKSSFNQPITGIKPIITDDCTDDPSIELEIGESAPVSVTPNQMWSPDEPLFSFVTHVSYSVPCSVTGLWFDLQFGFSPRSVLLDIAGDGDYEWGFAEPAFGHFGKQNVFWDTKVGEINLAKDSSMVTLGPSGVGQGGTFMLPRGANILAAEVALDQNTIYSNNNPEEGFVMDILSGSQNVTLGEWQNVSTWSSGGFHTPDVDFKGALNSLMNNPMVPTSHVDQYGNEWISFHFKAQSPNASTGASMRMQNLIILYDWNTELGSTHDLVRELSQGIALGTEVGGFVDVPFKVHATSGGALSLFDLSVTSANGYDSTLTLTDSPEGLYPDGRIIEAVSMHNIDSSTGASFQEARLRIESTSGSIELGYSDLMDFWEVDDSENLITLQSSTAEDLLGAKKITWRFTINPSWEDSPEARLFATLIADNGVEGLPGAVALVPSEGNAIENDAGLTAFDVQNSAGESLTLSDARSNQMLRLVGSIRLEGLDAAPDPSAYRILLERLIINNTDPSNITYSWLEISNASGPNSGDFDWQVDLGEDAAGTENYRFRMSEYSGGDTLCPPAEYFPGPDCEVEFQLTIDTYSPSLVETMVWDGSASPSHSGGYWRPLYDDTWVEPSQTQWFNFSAQDIPEPPEKLMLNYWVQQDHDDGDGIPQESEYRQLEMTGDGGAPISFYYGSINDIANDGYDGRVSLYVSGNDLAGNLIMAGSPGLDHDLVSYVGMGSRNPGIESFKIRDSAGNEFDTTTKTMYAGNEYHLIVEGRDDNGWRDIQSYEIDLNPGVPGDMVLKYYPRNNTVITDSQWIEIIDASNESDGTQMLRRNGQALIDPFETEFMLDMPIRLQWAIPTATSVMTPQVRVKDLDPNNPSSVLTESGGRYKQRWIYGDGFLLDTTSLQLADMTGPFITESVYDFGSGSSMDYVYSGDTVQFSGQYAFKDGYPDHVVTPEIPMVMVITREDASADSSGNEQLLGETTYHPFDGGTFTINLTAPSKTNDFRYTFQVQASSLPEGAVDHTTASQVFRIKVDSSAPEVLANTWQVTDTKGATLSDGIMPSSSIHCVDVQLMIKETERLSPQSIYVNWMYFQNGENWSFAESNYGGALSKNLSLVGGGDQIIAESAECIDLWPDGHELPSRAQLQNVILRFWVTGRDTAGLGLSGGGDSENPIRGTQDQWTSEYEVVYEQAEFAITQFKMFPNAPEVGEDVQLDITVRNDGNTEGILEMKIEVVSASDGARFTAAIVSTKMIGVFDGTLGSNSVNMEVPIEPFREAKADLHFEITNNLTGELIYTSINAGQTYDISLATQTDDSLPIGMILAALGALIGILIIVVVVLVLRGRSEGEYDDEYEYEDEKSYPTLPYEAQQGYGGGAEGAYGGGGYDHAGGGYGSYGTDVSAEMQQALAEFPQWDQQTIQGYFDMGWSVEQLRDWVRQQG